MQNKINLELVTEFLKDNKIRRLYELDTVPFVYFLFLIKKYKESKDYNDLLKKAKTSKEYVTQKIVYHFMMDDYIKEIYPIKDSILSYYDNLETVIQTIVYQYLLLSGLCRIDLGRLSHSLLPNDIGSLLIFSTFVPSFFFEGNNTYSSIEYDFNIDYLNTLMGIIFELNNIPYKESNELKADGSFDTIIYLPPYKYSYLYNRLLNSEKSYGLSSSSYEAKTIYKFSRMLNDKGSMIAITVNNTFTRSKDIQYKKSLIEKGKINSVIELPKLKDIPYQLSLFYFNDNNDAINLINASKIAQSNKKNNEIDYDKIIRALIGQIDGTLLTISNSDAIKDNYSLVPRRMFEKADNNNSDSLKLKDVTKIIYRGYQISKDMFDEYSTNSKTNYKLLSISDIMDDEIDYSNLQSLKSIDRAMNHYIIQNKDIVITCKGKSIKTAVVEVPNKDTIVFTGSLIVIRVDDTKIDPYFLKIYLDSNIGLKDLKSIQTGTTVLSLNPTSMLNLNIPLPDLDTQYRISSSYKYKLKNIKEVKEVVDDMKKELKKRFDDNFMDLIK